MVYNILQIQKQKESSIYRKKKLLAFNFLIYKKKKNSKPVILEGDGVIATLSFNNLKKIIGDSWKIAMEKNEKSHEVFFFTSFIFIWYIFSSKEIFEKKCSSTNKKNKLIKNLRFS